MFVAVAAAVVFIVTFLPFIKESYAALFLLVGGGGIVSVLLVPATELPIR